MIRPICSWLGSLASVGGLIYVFWPQGGTLSLGQSALLTTVAAVYIIAIVLECRDYWRCRPHRYKTHKQVHEFMYRWIERGGRVVIFTRDMSWANEDEMKKLLIAKAGRSELTVCLPEHISLSNELQKAGAEILRTGHVPQSRFTIINDSSMNGGMVIARRVGEIHVIDEYANGQHPIYAVARDLVEIARKLPQ